MSIIRIKKAHKPPYVILDTTALNDARLSFRAKGIHTYLMARPDDWEVHIDHLMKQSPREARDAIRGAMMELDTCGYIRRVRIRGDNGRMAGWDTTVYETPLLALLDAEDERLVGMTVDTEVEEIGLESEDSPTLDYPTSVQPTSDNPTSVPPITDLPTSDNPMSVEALITEVPPITDNPMSVPPKSDSPKSANPHLLRNKEETKETTNITPSLSAPTKKGRQKVTTPPPETFAPSENLRAWHTREFPQYDLPDAIDSCLDHYRKKGEQAANYEAAIRNWFRSGHKYGTLKAATTTRKPKFVE
jgi:hypothetical protein